jgi:amyloid beta precursor protein binding protein 1
LHAEKTAVETHALGNHFDLRLDRPWKQLEQHAETVDLTELDTMALGHVPYIVILLKQLSQWRVDVRFDDIESYLK